MLLKQLSNLQHCVNSAVTEMQSAVLLKHDEKRKEFLDNIEDVSLKVGDIRGTWQLIESFIAENDNCNNKFVQVNDDLKSQINEGFTCVSFLFKFSKQQIIRK